MTTPIPDQRPAPDGNALTGARLRKHADYQRAYAASRKRQSASMSWFLAPQLRCRSRRRAARRPPRRPHCRQGAGQGA